MSTMKVKSEFRAEVDEMTEQEAWQKAAFWQSLPSTCPVDGSPVRFGYAKRDGYDFYYLESTGEQRYEFQFGQSLEDKSLFPGKVRKGADGKKSTVQQWAYYDADKQTQVVVWENGRTIGGNAKQSPSTLAGNGKQDYTEQVQVASHEAIDAAIDEVLGGADAQSNRLGADATDAQRGTMHSLGIALYGTTEKWNAARPGWCEWASAGQKDSSKALDTTEMKALISELEVKVRGMYDKLADRCNQARVRIDNVNPDQLFGVELAHSYTGALKTYKTSQAQRVAA
jgi:hypothetical protein